jgi:hypothetical protein
MPAPWLARLNAPEQTALSDVAIRLADEGVPLCAIARATRIPSDELREQLRAAQEDGRLIELPRHDWPPYDTRPRRVVAKDRDQQAVTLRALTGATRSEANLLLDLCYGQSICKGRYASPGAVDVHIFHLRQRLAPHDIAILSVLGQGYRLSGEDRARLLVMIEQARVA